MSKMGSRLFRPRFIVPRALGVQGAAGGSNGAAFDPDTLFVEADTGDFWDFRTSSGMYKDVSKTMPVTTAGDVVEKVEGLRTTGTPTDLNVVGSSDLIWQGDSVSGDASVNNPIIRWFDGAASPYHEYANGLTLYTSFINIAAEGSDISQPILSHQGSNIFGLVADGTYFEVPARQNREFANGGIGSSMAYAGEVTETFAIVYDGVSATADCYKNGVFHSTLTKGSETYWRAIFGVLRKEGNRVRTWFVKEAASSADDIANLHTWGGGS